MKPEPRQKIFPSQKRLSGGRKAVTVCIAGIHEGRVGASIMLVCDRRVSVLGGWFSQDGNAKYTQVHTDWFGLFAGDVEETNLMLREVNRSLAALKAVPFETVVKRCRLAYAKVRKLLIETRVLPEFDVSTYRKFQELKRTDEVLYLTIKDKVTAVEENWNLLFAGFDNRRCPHLFIISGPGIVQYCDSQKYAAIGSGAFAALVWLAFYGYGSRRPIGELLFGVLSAKFFAEKASDVGQTTLLSTVKSDISALFHFNNDEVSAVKKAWEGLAKYPDASAKDLENKMAMTYQMFSSAFPSATTKPPSTFQKSARAK
jgi:hypothetical protein